jgi:nicotinamidase-related amidase
MCIDTTVRAASDMGFKVTLVGDACATKDLDFNGVTVSAASVQAAYLAAIDGSFAQVTEAQSLV